MDALEAPKWDFNDFREPIAMTPEHEKYVTLFNNELYGLSRQVKDWKSCRFLDRYLAEQTEKGHNAHEMLSEYDLSC